MNRGIILPVFVDLLLIVEWRTEGVPMTKETKIKEQKKAEEDANLDEALAETFPACKFARNNDPLRGDFASNSNPS